MKVMILPTKYIKFFFEKNMNQIDDKLNRKLFFLNSIFLTGNCKYNQLVPGDEKIYLYSKLLNFCRDLHWDV